MDLHFKDMENNLKANSKSNRFLGFAGGGGMGMMGIQNMWSNTMGMRAQGHGGIGGMGRYGNSPAFHPYPMDHQRGGGPSYHSSSYHTPHDRRSYESPSYYRGDRHRRTPSSRDYDSHRRRYRSRSRTPQRRRDYTPNRRYYEDRHHGGHRSPLLNRATNNGDEVGNSGNVPRDSGAVHDTGSNDRSMGSAATAQNLSNE